MRVQMVAVGFAAATAVVLGHPASPVATQAPCDVLNPPVEMADLGDPAALGPSALYQPDAPDTDGDGEADIIDAGDENDVVISRSDGTLTITTPGRDVRFGAGARQVAVGDLDGDGRDELRIQVQATDGRSVPGTVVPLDQESYLVPGTTPVGTHAVEEIGIRLDLLPQHQAVGDQDGDGADDLAFRAPQINAEDNGWAVLAGPTLMAPGPGGAIGDARGASSPGYVSRPHPKTQFFGVDPIRYHLGPSLAVIGGTDSSGPMIITGGAGGDFSYQASSDDRPARAGRAPNLPQPLLIVHGPQRIQLVPVAPQGSEMVLGSHFPGPEPVGSIDAFHRDGAVLVTLRPPDPEEGSLAIWNLSEACAVPLSFWPTPAGPVAGDPTYTG